MFFLDCGAHDGCSVKKFKNEIDLDNKFKIYAFEANPIFNQFHENKNYEYFNCAVSDIDGELEFFLSRESNMGSSICIEKKSADIDVNEPIKVKSICLSNFIKNNFNIKDYIILKLDVEGAEYRILKKLIKDKTIDYINELYIEWHKNVNDYNPKIYDQLNNILKKKKIKLIKWDASKYAFFLEGKTGLTAEDYK